MIKRTLFFLLFLSGTLLSAQENLRAVRCSAVDGRAPINNVFVDEDNNKWVSNSKGLFQVHDIDLSTPVKLGTNERSVLQFPGGNTNMKFSMTELNDALGGILNSSNKVTAANYHEAKDELWIGTSESGVFILGTNAYPRVFG